MKQTPPTFLGIGAQKAGTTWLYNQLVRHPEIWLPPIKEMHFFDRSEHYRGPNKLTILAPFKNFVKPERHDSPGVKTGLETISSFLNEDWYRGLFSYAARYKARGEITPSYSILESADVAQIKAINPDMKFIFMIRNPIERAISAIRFNVSRSWVDIDLGSDDDIISTLKSSGLVSRGNYEQTLMTYLEHFDSSQILLGFYDAIQQDPSGLMSGITGLLGVAPFEHNSVDFRERVNASPAHKMSDSVMDYLSHEYAPMIHRMAEQFGSYAIAWSESLHPARISSKTVDTTTHLPATIHP